MLQRYNLIMGRKKTYDRDDVLERAMTLFWKVGFEGAHLADLVAVTGLNRFGLYKEFEGKSGLFEEALAFYLEGAKAHYINTLLRHPLGVENIKAYFNNIQFDADYHGCFMINTLIEKHVVSEKSFAMVSAFTHQAKQLFKDNIKAAIAAKQISADINADAAAGYLLTLDQGLALYGINDPNNDTKNSIMALALKQLLAPPNGDMINKTALERAD